MSDRNTGKSISLILRHKPEVIGITLDEYGWADVEELIRADQGHSIPADVELKEAMPRISFTTESQSFTK